MHASDIVLHETARPHCEIAIFFAENRLSIFSTAIHVKIRNSLSYCTLHLYKQMRQSRPIKSKGTPSDKGESYSSSIILKTQESHIQ